MRFCKVIGTDSAPRVGIIDDDEIVVLSPTAGTLTELLSATDVRAKVQPYVGAPESRVKLADAQLLPPVDEQEVWAAGVTYKRSQKARMDESEDAASFYDKVYSASRPELFFKATPHRIAGPGQPIRIRCDTKWSVPEPELTLVMNSDCRIVGYTIGNDMSARDIEGENPLYLPQAKVYNQCAGLGPFITLADAMPPLDDVGVALAITRDHVEVFSGTTKLSQLNRTVEELAEWLAIDNSFPNGVFLMTGTGIVPPDDFTLRAGDLVSITIDGIGTLSNPVVQGNSSP